MGEKLLRYYQYVADQNGLASKIMLANETKIPSIKAATEPDSPANVAAFQQAVAKITGKPAPSF
jgi:hypothetical protein